MKEIIVIHENKEWLEPLYAEFEKRGCSFSEWFIHEGVVALDSVPKDAVYYNRMSASSHTRGHRFSPELTRAALTWLEEHPVEVVNGTEALYLEVCKISQYAALREAGVKVPRTRAVSGKSRVITAAEDFQQWPLILKPNRGGKGLGVLKFDDIEGLKTYLSSDDYAEPLDGLWLLQEYIKPKDNRITRCEFVGRNFVYAVDVDTSEGFELCPADVCAIDDQACPVGAGSDSTSNTPSKFTITNRFDNYLILTKLHDFMHNARIDVAGIEVIEDEQGDLYVYDVNTNTNYNQDAERAAGIETTGMGALADYLIGLAKSEG
ncbi:MULTISPECIES: RimK family alpha-L-glutamate ligase [Gammaproteobacteria]|uniref:ATP-grasp domain-containing protein n=1 Tax=Gammaproteobacteria TaxID=1236 RepID=UPI000DCF987D|nr:MULTISPECIES: alpha-L-glutamate ligase [Gammaproteobacteria]RTE85784.1 alpha-L-glutamate ligase [Aliidiomarina sp. B3213]TCZ90213.1 alpha-L-glutamate ligase [Lysobacter sp. N42]